MALNPVQRGLTALQRILDFAEAPAGTPSPFPAVLVESKHGYLGINSEGTRAALMMTANEIEWLRLQLRGVVRTLAVGGFAPVLTVSNVQVRLSADPPRRRGRIVPRFAGAGVAGKDALLLLAVQVLLSVPLTRLSACAAPDCGRAFIRVTRKRFCSARCQSRMQMRKVRAAERAESVAFAKRSRHGQTTRAR
jgi:CGNR zinc finger